MDTPPDGTSPTMAMFLFLKSRSSPFRDVNGGDDAAVVYHEYTHGLSSRLVTISPGGEQALNGHQSGAMGEGWSDWYAKDFLVSQFPADDTAAAGDVHMGKYIDSIPHSIRTPGPRLPGQRGAARSVRAPRRAGAGGYTYGDFGRIDFGPEVHADGEIWAETLWDLRAAVGSPVARAIVTQGMRFSPPEPTFLDERDAILTADAQLFPDGDHSGAIWGAFGPRGMGTDAQSPTQDTAFEGFKRPPTAALAVSPSPAIAGPAGELRRLGLVRRRRQRRLLRLRLPGRRDARTITGTTNPRQSFSYRERRHVPPPRHRARRRGPDRYRRPGAARDARRRRPPRRRPRRPPASKRPTITSPARAPRAACASRSAATPRCAGTAKLTITRKLAKKLHLGKRRTVGSLRVGSAQRASKRFTIKLSKRTLRAMRRAGVRRLTTRLTVTVTDAERQRATKGRGTRIRR